MSSPRRVPWSASVLRAIVVATPIVLLASALYAAPKTKPGAKPAASTSADAAVETGPRETKIAAPSGDAGSGDAAAIDAGKAATKGDRGASTVGDGGVREGERKEGDASVKTFDFGSTEITGKARWPAVTYFTRRLKAEFDAQKLPHRSFFPEMSATKGEGSAR